MSEEYSQPAASAQQESEANAASTSPDATSAHEQLERAERVVVDAAKSAADAASRAAEAAASAADRARNAVAEELQDPAVSTTVVFASIVTSAATVYLSNQHRAGKFSWLLAGGVAAGVAALSVAEYFSVKAYFKHSDE